MVPTLQPQAMAQLSMFSTSSKSRKSLSVWSAHSLPMPQTVLGDRVSLWNSPGCCCSYGHAARCVCVQPVSPTLYILPSLSQLGLGVSLCGTRALLRRGGKPLSYFLSDLSSAAGASNWAFLPQLIKSLTGW